MIARLFKSKFLDYPSVRIQLFDCLIFLYFLTLSADLLYFEMGLFKAKFNHLIALSLGMLMLTAKKTIVIERKALQSFALILASLVLSALFSSSIERCVGYIFVYLFSFLFYFVIPYNLMARQDQRKILKLYSLSFFCVGGFALLQLLLSGCGIDPPFIKQKIGFLARPHALTYEPSYYALYMTAFVMAWNVKRLLTTQFSLMSKQTLSFLGVNALLLISTATSAFFTYVLFFLICLFFSLTSLSMMQSFKRNLLKFSLIFGGIFMIAAGCIWSFFLVTFFKFFSLNFMLHHSFAERWQGVKNCFDLFVSHPFLGVGLGGVNPFLFQEGKGESVFYDLEEISPFEPMNVFTEVLASLGVVGIFSFLFLLRIFIKKFQQSMANPLISEERKHLICAFFLSLVTVLFALQFNQGLFRPYIWVHAALAYALMNSFKWNPQEVS